MTDHPVTCLVANEGDAVAMLRRMHARAVHSANRGEVPRISSAEVLAVLRATQAERARHAEEVAALRDQLRRVEGERDEAQRQCGELHEHLARAWEEGAEAAFDAQDEFYASNPYRGREKTPQRR